MLENPNDETMIIDEGDVGQEQSINDEHWMMHGINLLRKKDAESWTVCSVELA